MGDDLRHTREGGLGGGGENSRRGDGKENGGGKKFEPSEEGV